MQVWKRKDYAHMTLELDVVRQILLRIEDDPQMDGNTEFAYDSAEELGIVGTTTEQVAYHLALLIEAGYVDGAASSATPLPVIRRLTWKGHEFLGTIRSEDVWTKTKTRLSGLGRIALPIVAAIAEAELKQKLGLH